MRSHGMGASEREIELGHLTVYIAYRVLALDREKTRGKRGSGGGNTYNVLSVRLVWGCVFAV